MEEEEKEKQPQESLPSVGRVVPAKPETIVPMGRGALLAGLRQSMLAKQAEQEPKLSSSIEQQQNPKPAVSQMSGAAAAGDAPPKPLGRGLAQMRALMAQQSQQQQVPHQQSQVPIRAPFIGRGQSVLTKPPSATHQSSRASSHSDEASGSETPSEALSKMSLDEKPKNPNERPRRPTVTKIGTEGTPTSLAANYVRVLCKNQGVYLYHVGFSPVIDNRRLKAGLLAQHRDRFKTISSFDGSTLYLPHKLQDAETVVTSTRKTDGSAVTITVTFVKAVPPEQCCHLYNVIFRKIMHILEMCQVGRYYYNPHTPASVPQYKLEVWPGYITAIKEHEGGLLLLLDASHRVLRTQTVLEIMENDQMKYQQSYLEEITKKLVGSTVLTRYNNKTYRVDDIVWDKNPLHKFDSRASGESMSFEDYYRKQHNIEIKSKTQPLLLHKRKPPKGAPPGFKMDPEFLCLIPELCYSSGLTDDMRSNFSMMKDLAAHTRVTPAQRQLAMKKFIDNVNGSPEALAALEEWGLQLDSSLVSINGRQLPMEKIMMGQKEFSAGPQSDWSREATRNQLVSPVNLVNWGIFFTRRDASKANDFVKHMQTETKNMGISCQVPFRKELMNDRIETLVQELRNSINDKVQLVVVINPTNRDDRYSAIKKVCCVEAPVPSQVIIAKTISRPEKLRSVVQKIALQINCKLGGELWAVKIPFNKLMVVGIDSYHDAAKGKQSVGGFVASMNRLCTRWYSNVCFQRPGQELVHGLQICLTSALRKYHAENHFLPEKIVIFRDGVGDGQLDMLADHEVKQLHRCFSSFGEYTPQCTTVCVQKRINTRIYSRDRDEGGMVNPPPGTVVDSVVTRRDRYDFFIVSQHVRQGTVSPTHYIVVDDGLDLAPGYMQRLTYKMTHLYYNWPGTVRVPAPCQYAHKLAYLVGESIHKEPAECLSDRLFFL
ncbi:hypothetical protein RRG08_056298 [Elysia crispata]|uniref:Uncharacterized protein n=1 Tax=Elysia crispata TaxID=231223 RepID=A0AAE1E5L0_9GAST|nr:hypothetical protein RRG08_056298 [Elysia crispata]